MNSYEISRFLNIYDNTNLILSEKLRMIFSDKFEFELFNGTLSNYVIYKSIETYNYNTFLSISHIDGLETYNRIIDKEKFSSSESYFTIKDTIITILDKGIYKHIFICNTACIKPRVKLEVYGCNISLISRIKRYIYNILKL